MKYLVNIAPLSKRRFKSVLTYTHDTAISGGVFVRVPFQSGFLTGVVISSVEASAQKQFLRRIDYELRPIAEVLSQYIEVRLFENILQFASKYIIPLADLFGHVLPRFIYDTSLNLPDNYIKSEPKIIKGEVNFLYKPHFERTQYILNLVTKKHLMEESVILVLPTNTHVREWVKIMQRSKNILHVALHSEITKERQLKLYRQIYECRKPLVILATPKFAYIPYLKNISYIVELAHHPYYKITGFNKNWPDLEYIIMLANSLSVQCIIADSIPSLEYMAHKNDAQYYTLGVPHYLIPQNLDYLKSSGIKPNTSHVFSTPTMGFIKETLMNTDKKILIFTPYSGAYSCTLCSDCGFIFYCPTCKKNLTAFKCDEEYVYACARCNINYSLPALCPKCSSHKFSFYGFGPDNIKDEIKRALDLSDDEFVILGKTKQGKQKGNVGIIPRIIIANQKLFSHIHYNFDISIITTLAPLFSSDDLNSSYNIIYYLLKIFESTNERVIFEDENIHPYIKDMLQKKTVETFLNKEIEVRKEYGSPPFGSYISVKIAHSEKDASIIIDYVATQCENLGIIYFKKHTYIPISKSHGTELIVIPANKNKLENAQNFLLELVDVAHIVVM